MWNINFISSLLLFLWYPLLFLFLTQVLTLLVAFTFTKVTFEHDISASTQVRLLDTFFPTLSKPSFSHVQSSSDREYSLSLKMSHTRLLNRTYSHTSCVRGGLSPLRGSGPFCWRGRRGGGVGAIQGMLCGLHDLTCLWSWRGSRPLTQGSKTRKMKKGDRVGGFRL